jgi:hypothetical protein
MCWFDPYSASTVSVSKRQQPKRFFGACKALCLRGGRLSGRNPQGNPLSQITSAMDNIMSHLQHVFVHIMTLLANASRGSDAKKATNGDSLPPDLPRAGSVNGS